MSLIVTIFFIVFLTELVSWVGKSVLVEFVRRLFACLEVQPRIRFQAWGLYCRVFMSVQYARQHELKAELLATKKELMQTSAQDQFAKWAKLRRSVDKGIAELERLSEPHSSGPADSHTFAACMRRVSRDCGLMAFLSDGELATTKSAFSARFNGLVWILTTGLQFAIGWWYRRSAVFYLPANWFGPLTWTLALPFAPQGSSHVVQ